jgi:hypothetical protein
MKLVIKTAFFNVLCIFIFALIYYYFYNEFENHVYEKKNTFIDFLLLSTTIQAGVGIPILIPSSFYSKLFIIIHQILKIFTYIITIYIFTI